MSETTTDVSTLRTTTPGEELRPLSAAELSTGLGLLSEGREAGRISVDDLKRRATRISDLAQAEFQVAARQPMSRYVAVGAVVFIAAISIAYFAGANRARRDV